MMDQTEFSDIAPFNDEEASAALARVANHPNVPWISKYIFPDKPESFLKDILKNIHSVDEFQDVVMSQAIEWIITRTVRNFSYDGISKVMDTDRKYLFISNHNCTCLPNCCPGISGKPSLPGNARCGSHSARDVPKTAATPRSRAC